MNRSFKLFDQVRLKQDLAHPLAKKGMIGAIIEVFESPQEAFEVEFVDESGRTVAQVTVEPQQIEAV